MLDGKSADDNFQELSDRNKQIVLKKIAVLLKEQQPNQK